MKLSTYIVVVFMVIQLFFALLVYSEDRPYKKYNNQIFLGNLVELRFKEALPPDAADYVSRYRECIHWRGEDAYDAARAKDIQKGIDKSCSDLKDRRKMIDQKYPQGSEEFRLIQSIIEDVDKGQTIPSFIWNDPKGKSKVLDEYFEAKAQSVVHELEKQLPEYEAVVSALKKYEPSLQKDESERRRLKESLDMIIFRLNVQKNYLIEITNNSHRLHPLTRKEIANAKIKLESTVTPK